MVYQQSFTLTKFIPELFGHLNKPEYIEFEFSLKTYLIPKAKRICQGIYIQKVLHIISVVIFTTK